MEDSELSATGKDSDSDPAPQTAEAAPPPAKPADEASLERERWLRHRFDTEHQVTLAMMRMLVAGARNEGPAMRFWRWLIDDFRSERRLLQSPNEDGWDERLVLGRLRSWFTRRGTPRDSGGPGLSERGI